jgi:hypothetical protein
LPTARHAAKLSRRFAKNVASIFRVEEQTGSKQRNAASWLALLFNPEDRGEMSSGL